MPEVGAEKGADITDNPTLRLQRRLCKTSWDIRNNTPRVTGLNTCR